MEIQTAVENLRRFPDLLSAILKGLTDEQILYRPESGNWSIQEIVCHLADEEEFDFPVRLKLTIDGKTVWPPIAPERWATERDYQSQDFQRALQRFIELRTASMNWLNGQTFEPRIWEASFVHPALGPISAGDLLFSWSVHDLLHLKQITKRLFEHTQKCAGSHSTQYAGQW